MCKKLENVKRLYLFVIFIMYCPLGYGQYMINGKIIDKKSKEPIDGAGILDNSSKKFTFSDENGNFQLSLINKNTFVIITSLGKKEMIINPATDMQIDSLTVQLEDNNLLLNNVEVTAKYEEQSLGSVIKLDKYAILQFQSFSLSEVLDQIPGQTISNPNLNTAQSISLRTASPDTNNAFGVSFVMDGMQLSNDENMQTYGTGKFTDYNKIKTGMDLRNIPTSDIESIEVISGIPDAKYGNLTSGVININRQAGVTPLRTGIKFRQGNTSIYVGKGVGLGAKFGQLSLSLDYLNANKDPRKSLESYNRITTTATWTKKKANFKNTLSFTVQSNFDELKVDKEFDNGRQNAKRHKNTGFRINNRAKWNINHWLTDNVQLGLGFSYFDQDTYTQSLFNGGGQIVPVALETALMPGEYTPVAYLATKHTLGKPLSANLSINMGKNFSTGELWHHLGYGGNASYSDNLGEGKIYDTQTAHLQATLKQAVADSSPGTRDLNFRSKVKPLPKIGAYVQDNISYKMANGQYFQANIGVRFDHQYGHNSFGPRINTSYELNPHIKLRAGMGFSSKAPSLANLYIGDRYYDIVVANFRTSQYAFNLVQTYVEKLQKQELEASKAWKYEVGVDVKTKIGKLNITGYHNRIYNGFTSKNNRLVKRLPELEFRFTDPNAPPTYEITGYKPLIISYSSTVNAQQSINKGVEFRMSFNKIERIHTTFNLSGAYINTKSTGLPTYEIRNTNKLNKTLYYGVYETTPSQNSKLSLRMTFAHHISKLGLLISITSEQFTYGKNYATLKSIYPIAYINPAMEYIPIAEGERTNHAYRELFRSPTEDKDVIAPIYHNFHLRITKEMLNGLGVSLYVNNFLNYRPITTNNLNKQSRQNTAINFGASLNFQF